MPRGLQEARVLVPVGRGCGRLTRLGRQASGRDLNDAELGEFCTERGCLREYRREHGLPPSRTDVALGLGFRDGSSVISQLNALVKKGWIQMEPGKPRPIRVIDEDLPLLKPLARGARVASPERRGSSRPGGPVRPQRLDRGSS